MPVATTTQPVNKGEDYQRDSWRIHVEERSNGWGFRMQSSVYFCLLCFGGFESKFDCLEFADDLIEHIHKNVE